MNRRLDIAIIADDLTGAADAGVQFCPYLGPIYMTGGEQSGLDSIDIQSRGVTVFTNTRNIPLRRQLIRFIGWQKSSKICIPLWSIKKSIHVCEAILAPN